MIANEVDHIIGSCKEGERMIVQRDAINSQVEFIEGHPNPTAALTASDDLESGPLAGLNLQQCRALAWDGMRQVVCPGQNPDGTCGAIELRVKRAN